MSELLPCPFCGGALLAVDPRLGGTLEHPATPDCPISALCYDDTPENRAAWNRRAPSGDAWQAPDPTDPRSASDRIGKHGVF